MLKYFLNYWCKLLIAVQCAYDLTPYFYFLKWTKANPMKMFRQVATDRLKLSNEHIIDNVTSERGKLRHNIIDSFIIKT